MTNEELLKRCTEALGGIERLAKIRNIYTFSEIKAKGLEGIYMRQWVTSEGKSRVEIEWDGARSSTIFDGQRAWRKDYNGWVRELDGLELEETVTWAFLNSYSHLVLGRMEGQIEGPVERRERVSKLFRSWWGWKRWHHILSIKPKGGQEISYYLNNRTFLPTKCEQRWGRLLLPGCRESLVTFFKDYQEVEGVKYPFKIKVDGGPLCSYLREVKEVCFNCSMDDDLFTRPEETGKFRVHNGERALGIPYYTDSCFNGEHGFADGGIHLLVRINGKKVSPFHLDTGSSVSRVCLYTKKYPEKLLRYRRGGPVFSLALSKIETLDVVNIRSIISLEEYCEMIRRNPPAKSSKGEAPEMIDLDEEMRRHGQILVSFSDLRLAALKPFGHSVICLLKKDQPIYPAPGLWQRNYPPQPLSQLSCDALGLSADFVVFYDCVLEGGILGSDFIARFVVEIDYANKVINLFSPQNYTYPDKGEVLDITLTDGIPWVKAKVNGEHEGEFLVDTGENHGISLNKSFIRKYQIKYDKREWFTAREFEREVIAEMGQLRSLSLGRFTLKSPTFISGMSLGDPDLGGIIGNEILKRFKVTLDYSRKKMILEPNEYFNEPF